MREVTAAIARKDFGEFCGRVPRDTLLGPPEQR